ncbi:MAG: diguanylate cyclase [Candidatus Cohnella colombiensis]|uniref:Diguanylate cyclase n=1 Tax=Candidatus Cohnella colombiensis TaxID=3121368 RepID=A0AA95F1Y8_9BACL|nr:MAG: diguanylate cyclase [Cohnella sp.]
MLLRHHGRLLFIYFFSLCLILLISIYNLVSHHNMSVFTIIVSVVAILTVHFMYLVASRALILTGESERRYRNLVERAPDAIAVHQDGIIVFANPACATLMGISDCSQLIGLPMLKFVPHQYKDIVRKRATSAMNDHNVGQLEEQFVRLDGKIIDVEVTAIGIPYMGKPAVLIIVREIGHHKDVERQLTETNAHFRRLSSLDGLTGILNRRTFDEDLLDTWGQLTLNLYPICLIFIDVDNFKEYNDFYGHMAGDLCLQMIAHKLDNEARIIAGNAYRYGGEEFAVVFPALSMLDPMEAADRLRESISSCTIPHHGLGEDAVVTISVGVVSNQWAPYEHQDDFVRAADLALYEAKKQGRNSTVAANQLHFVQEKH